MQLTPWSADLLKQRARRVGVAVCAQVLGLATLAMAFGLPDLGLAIVGVALAVLPSAAMHLAPTYGVRGESRPLSGQGCIRMKALAGQHKEVRGFLGAIHAMEREVVWADLWQVNGWLRARKDCAHRAEELAACKAVNGLS